MFYKFRNTLFAYAMVRVFTYHAAIAAVLLPPAFGCKRENPNQFVPNQLGAATETNKVQQWLKGNPKALAGLRSSNGAGQKVGTTLPSLTLQWKDAKFDATARTYYVPAAFANTKGAGGKPNIYLVATENEQGQVTGGRYVLMLPNAQKMGKGQAGFNPVALLGTEKPADLPTGKAGFSGALLYYDVQGQLTGSQVYEAGQIQPKATANLAARDEAEGDPDPNYVIQECGNLTGTSPCIEWYWQTYVNGVLAEEDYMFTTCCGGSSGGGSGNNSAECQATLESFANQGNAVSGPAEVTSGVQTATLWPKSYKWQIFDAVTWWLYSFEDAVWEKKYYPSSGQSIWEFKSIVHNKIGEAGFNIGGTRTWEDNGATFNMQRFSTLVDLKFSVKSSVACQNPLIPPVVRQYNTSIIFRTPNSVVYVNAEKQITK